MAKSNRGGYMMSRDMVRFISDQFDGTTCLARAGDEGVVVDGPLVNKPGFVRVKLDNGSEVEARHKVMIKIA